MKLTKSQLKQIIREEMDIILEQNRAPQPLTAIMYMPDIQWALDRAMDIGGEDLLRSEAERIKNIDVYTNAANRDEIYSYIDSVVRVRTSPETASKPHVKTTVASWRNRRAPYRSHPIHGKGNL